MRTGTLVFIFTLVAGGIATSAVGVTLAKDVARSTAAITISKTPTIPWYCTPIEVAVAPIMETGTSGYNTPGYTTPGYATPGYESVTPGYLTLIDADVETDAQTPIPPPIEPEIYFNAAPFAAHGDTLISCPIGFVAQKNLILEKCTSALHKKLEGSKLPADSAEQYATCKTIIQPKIWDSKINMRLCSMYNNFKTNCMVHARQRCEPFGFYMMQAGAQAAQLRPTILDVSAFCDQVY